MKLLVINTVNFETGTDPVWNYGSQTIQTRYPLSEKGLTQAGIALIKLPAGVSKIGIWERSISQKQIAEIAKRLYPSIVVENTSPLPPTNLSMPNDIRKHIMHVFQTIKGNACYCMVMDFDNLLMVHQILGKGEKLETYSIAVHEYELPN